MRAMLLAAGLGTRLKPFTNEHPKALAMVNGKSLLQRNIEYLVANQVNSIIINVHHFPAQIIEHLELMVKGPGLEIHISDESESVLETGGGLLKARPFLEGKEPFILMNVDILTDANLGQMLKDHNSSGAIATLAVSDRSTSRYLLFDDTMRLNGWRNIKTNEEKIRRKCERYFPWAFNGIHVLSPVIFSMIKLNGKFSMIDVYLELAQEQRIRGFDVSASKFIDVGTPESVQIAEEIF